MREHDPIKFKAMLPFVATLAFDLGISYFLSNNVKDMEVFGF